jgi:hypothetical protein
MSEVGGIRHFEAKRPTPNAQWQRSKRRTLSEPAAVNPPPLPVRKRFPWIFHWIVLALIAIVAFAPVGSVVACGLIANTHGLPGRRRVGASLRDWRQRLRATALYARRDGLAYADHPSCRRVGFCDVVDRACCSSKRMAQAHRQPGNVTGMKKMGSHLIFDI